MSGGRWMGFYQKDKKNQVRSVLQSMSGYNSTYIPRVVRSSWEPPQQNQRLVDYVRDGPTGTRPDSCCV